MHIAAKKEKKRRDLLTEEERAEEDKLGADKLLGKPTELPPAKYQLYFHPYS